MALEEWLSTQGVANNWEFAPTYVAAGVTIDDLATLVDVVGVMPPLLTWLCEWLTARGLLDELEQSTGRIAELVSTIKSYTYIEVHSKPGATRFIVRLPVRQTVAQ